MRLVVSESEDLHQCPVPRGLSSIPTAGLQHQGAAHLTSDDLPKDPLPQGAGGKLSGLEAQGHPHAWPFPASLQTWHEAWRAQCRTRM